MHGSVRAVRRAVWQPLRPRVTFEKTAVENRGLKFQRTFRIDIMKKDTQLGHLGRNPLETHGTVNMPVYRASTIVFPDLETYGSRPADESARFSWTNQSRGSSVSMLVV